MGSFGVVDGAIRTRISRQMCPECSALLSPSGPREVKNPSESASERTTRLPTRRHCIRHLPGAFAVPGRARTASPSRLTRRFCPAVARVHAFLAGDHGIRRGTEVFVDPHVVGQPPAGVRGVLHPLRHEHPRHRVFERDHPLPLLDYGRAARVENGQLPIDDVGVFERSRSRLRCRRAPAQGEKCTNQRESSAMRRQRG